jgi:CBS domain-containing protein
MRVADLMRRDFPRIRRNDNVEEAAKAMADGMSDAVLIADEDGPVGLLTERDVLVRVVAAGRDPSATPVWQVMTANLLVCTEQEAAEGVVDRMAEHGIEHMPVVDRWGRPIGLVARSAILAGLSSAPRA